MDTFYQKQLERFNFALNKLLALSATSKSSIGVTSRYHDAMREGAFSAPPRSRELGLAAEGLNLPEQTDGQC